MSSRVTVGASRLVIVALVASLSACSQTPTEVTPLTRAIGEIRSVLLQVSNLEPLDPAIGGTYHFWALGSRNQANLLGAFFVQAGGGIVDSAGVPIEEFSSDSFSINSTLGLLITIEPPGQTPTRPAGSQVMSGTVIDGVADLTVPISPEILTARGSVRVFTPSDGPNTNETSGLWMQLADGSPSLEIPDTTAALQFETFIEINGVSVSLGRFEAADQADTVNRFNSELFPLPERPGEDLLTAAPEGLSFPIDISGARVTISLEGRIGDFARQGQFIVFEAILPLGLVGGEQIPFTNLAASFPFGKAVLF